jgi:adenylosuccinate lyase
MIQRYSRPEMCAIGTDESKLCLWLQIELLAGEALACVMGKGRIANPQS